MRTEEPDVSDLKAHSQMLGRIAAEVEEWCLSGEYTTLDAVKLLKAEHMILKGESIKKKLEEQYS